MNTTLLFNEGVVLTWALNSFPSFAMCGVFAWAAWFLKGHVSAFDARVEKVETKNVDLGQKIDKLDERVTKLDEKVIALDKRIDDMKHELEMKIVESKNEMKTHFDNKSQEMKSHFDATVLQIVKHFDSTALQIAATTKKSQE